MDIKRFATEVFNSNIAILLAGVLSHALFSTTEKVSYEQSEYLDVEEEDHENESESPPNSQPTTMEKIHAELSDKVDKDFAELFE